jgi:hypothetical protein
MMASPLKRSGISNAKLAVGFLVGVATIGLAPVAYMFISPQFKVASLLLMAFTIAPHGTRSACLRCVG